MPHLPAAAVTAIDLFLATHPHADHIGQADRVLATFPVREVWASGDVTTTLTFERFLDAIDASDAGYHEPRAGETQVLASAFIEVVGPASIGGDLSENSIAVRITYGDVVFLFTGDAETGAESGMLSRGHNLRAQILQLGHHGSRTSSTQPFLNAVQPEVAIYSAGANNQYGHPHDEVIDRVVGMGIELYGTADHGTIVLLTDGLTYEVQTQVASGPRGPPAAGSAPGSGSPTAQVPDPTTPPTGAGCQPGQVDINTASATALEAIIHIGAARAQAMIGLRPFSSVNDMVRISGIASARLADIKAQGVACVG